MSRLRFALNQAAQQSSQANTDTLISYRLGKTHAFLPLSWTNFAFARHACHLISFLHRGRDRWCNAEIVGGGHLCSLQPATAVGVARLKDQLSLEQAVKALRYDWIMYYLNLKLVRSHNIVYIITTVAIQYIVLSNTTLATTVHKFILCTCKQYTLDQGMVYITTCTVCICYCRDTSKVSTPNVSPSVGKVEVKALSKEQRTIFLNRCERRLLLCYLTPYHYM